MQVLGVESNKVYFEGTRADCHKWLLETYPNQPEKSWIDGKSVINPPLLPEVMKIRGKVK